MRHQLTPRELLALIAAAIVLASAIAALCRWANAPRYLYRVQLRDAAVNQECQ